MDIFFLVGKYNSRARVNMNVDQAKRFRLYFLKLTYIIMIYGKQSDVWFARFDGVDVVKKRSKYVDFSIELEAEALFAIHRSASPRIASYFVKPIKTTGSTYRELITERIRGVELGPFVRDGASDATVLNMVAMTLLAGEKLRRETGVVHNDLHSSNVIVVKTDEPMATFDFDDGRSYRIDTFGYRPVVIDFGFAACPGSRYTAPMCCSDIGYTVEAPDPLADSRILLYNVSRSLRHRGVFNHAVTRTYDEAFGSLRLNEGWFRDGTFEDVLRSVVKSLSEGEREKKTRIAGSIFDPSVGEHYDLVNMFASAIRRSRYDAADESHASIDVGAYESLRAVFPKRAGDAESQLADVKTAMTIESDERAVKIFGRRGAELRNRVNATIASIEPFVLAALKRNARKKAAIYADLPVRDGLDVVDRLLASSS